MVQGDSAGVDSCALCSTASLGQSIVETRPPLAGSYWRNWDTRSRRLVSEAGAEPGRAIMDILCREGWRLNSTRSPFCRCRSTLSPTCRKEDGENFVGNGR